MHERAISFRRLQIRASGITERVTVNLPNPLTIRRTPKSKKFMGGQ